MGKKNKKEKKIKNRPQFEGGVITFTVLPHGYQADIKMTIDGKTYGEDEEIFTARSFSGYDVDGISDGARFYGYLLKIAEREIRPDETYKEKS
jgi:hypothetical protein